MQQYWGNFWICVSVIGGLGSFHSIFLSRKDRHGPLLRSLYKNWPMYSFKVLHDDYWYGKQQYWMMKPINKTKFDGKKWKKVCCHVRTQKRHGKNRGWINCIFLLSGSKLWNYITSGVQVEPIDYDGYVFKPKNTFGNFLPKK